VHAEDSSLEQTLSLGAKSVLERYRSCSSTISWSITSSITSSSVITPVKCDVNGGGGVAVGPSDAQAAISSGLNTLPDVASVKDAAIMMWEQDCLNIEST
jgi:hypothetical protein